jgi:hypothetical protein
MQINWGEDVTEYVETLVQSALEEARVSGVTRGRQLGRDLDCLKRKGSCYMVPLQI